jgi:hypothetical protein
MQQPLEQGGEAVPAGWTDRRAVATQQRLHSPEGVAIDEGGLLALVDLVLVAYIAGVDNVAEQTMQAGLGEGTAATQASLPCLPTL